MGHRTADREDWEELFSQVSIQHALAFSVLLWPDFTEIDGMVLIDEPVGQGFKNLEKAILEYGENRREIEDQFNLVEISALFPDLPGRDSESDEERLAEILSDAWRAKLAIEYPDRLFEVEVSEDDWGRWISFHQAR